MNAILPKNKSQLSKMKISELVIEYGYLKAENRERNCKDALVAVEEELKRRGVLDND